MTGFRFGASVLLMLLCAGSLFSEEKPWTEIRSPHFRLITNGDELTARHVLLRFELMRAVFESQFPHFKLDASAPLLIIAAKDSSTAKTLLPQFAAQLPGGLYHDGWERQYAFVRLDVISSDPEGFHTVYHEYVHSLLHVNFRWLPSWLDEGLAEFYGYTGLDNSRIYIGAPPNIAVVQAVTSDATIPLSKFVGSDMYAGDKSYHRYIQAWAFTHFLIFSPDMESGQRLQRFFNELQSGVEQKKAFEETFGKFADVQWQYERYINKPTFPTRVIPIPPRLNEKDFVARTMTLGETHAEFAAWYIRFHQWEQMRQSAEAALKSEPKLSLAHEDMGFYLFNLGKDAEALKEFSVAMELDDKNYIALFAKIMASPASRSIAAQDQQATYEGLNHVIDLKPDFAPAYIELAKLNVAEGNLAVALALSRKAEQLEPFRSGYHVLSGRIMLMMSRPSDAADAAAYVAQRWSGSDQDEAMELWNRIPAADRHVEAPVVLENSSKWHTAEGTVKSVACNGSAFAITLDINGQLQTFKAQGFPVGYSDTLWVGRDHFSPCFHVQGLRVMIRYKPGKDQSYAGDLVYAGFRDDLGAQPKTAATHASAR